MSRHPYSNRITADGLTQFSVWYLKQNGFLTYSGMGGSLKWENSFTHQITARVSIIYHDYAAVRYVILRYEAEGEPIDCRVNLVTTRCHFGGNRDWFVCPLTVSGVPCQRRVGVLYFVGRYFGCRYCFNLTYNSRRVGGWRKSVGPFVSFPKLEEFKKQAKRIFYGGKMTKKFRKYLKKQKQLVDGLTAVSKHLS